MANRPPNWYLMSYDEQQAWDRLERARQDVEYERDQAQQEAERAQLRANQLRREYRQEMDSAQSQREELYAELRGWREQASQRWRFIVSQGLQEAFDKWLAEDHPLPDEDVLEEGPEERGEE